MMEEPEQPEGDAPEDETPEGVPGEPGEATPAADEAPADSEAPGPEIEGLEELADGQGLTPEGSHPPSPEGSDPPSPEGSEPASDEQPAPAEQPRERGVRPAGDGQKGKQEDVIPGLHLEPDLVLEEQRQEGAEGAYGEYDQYADADGGDEEEAGDDAAEAAPVAHTPLELAADARYNATGKRKSAIARVILKPGEGTYTVNGRHLDEYFPRVRLQRMASQPLEAAGYHTRMDVVARIHGGGVSAQANALRHGIARALVEADPALRAELKRRGYLTRDPREKERKKAGLKKARKRPQFSKR
jgi:small subunit ribosomal protein S9